MKPILQNKSGNNNNNNLFGIYFSCHRTANATVMELLHDIYSVIVQIVCFFITGNNNGTANSQ